MALPSLLSKWFRIYLNAFILIGSAAPLFLCWFIWRVLSLLLPAHIYQIGDDLIFELYQRFSLILVEQVLGMKVYLYGDFPKVLETLEKENFLLMSNHQSATDWILSNTVAERLRVLGRLRYFMKDAVQYIPLYGFYFHQHGCIYINRKKCDFHKMKQSLIYLQNKNIHSCVVIFPEGTRYKGANHLKESHEFSVKNNLPLLNHVMYPRTRGLVTTVSYLGCNVKALYDITVVYGGTKISSASAAVSPEQTRLPPPSLIDMFTGQIEAIHIHLERIDIDKVPREEDTLKDFLYKQFQKKDRMMQEFYQSANAKHPFGGKPFEQHLNPPRQTIAFVALCLCMAYFCFTATGLWFSLQIWVFGTLFGYAWLCINSVS